VKKISIATTVFVLYAAACVFVFNTFWEESASLQTKQVTSADRNEQVLQEQAMMRKKDSLNRLEELKLAFDTLQQPVDPAPTLSREFRIAALTAAGTDGLYTPVLFNITDLNGTIKFTCEDQATIYLNSTKVKIPLGCKNYNAFLLDYLKNAPDTELLIIGSSGAGEANSLGKNRATFIKDLLVGSGIRETQLQTAGRVDNIPFELGTARGGINMVLLTAVVDLVKTKTNTTALPIENRSTEPFAFKKFTTGFQGRFYRGDQTVASYIASLKIFLNANTGKKVNIRSYADTVGSALDNVELTRQNARAIRKLMLEAGIPPSQIIVLPQDEKPQSSNNGKRCMIIIVK